MNLQDASANANVVAFLKMLRYGEGTTDPDGYRRMFGGKLFDSFADHPRSPQKATFKGGKTLTSSAAGAYQFLTRTWDGLVKQYGFTDFSPANQDLGAIALIAGRKALDDVIAGRFDAAVMKCNKEWASLPGSPYGQPTTTLQKERELYAAAGGTFAAAPQPMPQPTPAPGRAKVKRALPRSSSPSPEPSTMPPFLLAALPALFDAVPKLIKSFSDDGVTVPARNEQAVTLAMNVAKAALNAPNEQAVVDTLASDPEAAAVVRNAIDAAWSQITDVSGIAEARKADVAFASTVGEVWKSPSFIISVLLLPLVYMLVGAVVGIFGQPFSDDVRSAIANGVIGLILGGLTGYYFGQTTSRNRTPPAN